ncbi:E3 ubiquitin-protein ligase RNF126 [Galendromus occidentalis]|uniref:RING-type E3 ubiquitin transferase n=1 Tax=Galendromus occidentalis TaxID=34638 RepID=A0AAJ6QMK7_9ACAR|nr:E3 ubiquitin-protein ligase RNF126 [Galendromus occidentalis]
MAEASGDLRNRSSPRFFCHKCNVEVEPERPDLTCPRCQGGFIEELEETEQQANADQDSWSDLVTHTLGRSPTPGFLINQLFSGIIDNGLNLGNYNLQAGPLLMQVHGNPGDYAWGRGGLDAVITHLLNQLEGTGQAPLAKDQIQAIPEVKISPEQVAANMQCSVCMEDFVKDEVTRRLVCGHHFHTPCIVPWLELHATCPICRLQLDQGGSSSSSSGSSSGSSAQRRPTPSTSVSGPSQSRPAYQEDECD